MSEWTAKREAEVRARCKDRKRFWTWEDATDARDDLPDAWRRLRRLRAEHAKRLEEMQYASDLLAISQSKIDALGETIRDLQKISLEKP